MAAKSEMSGCARVGGTLFLGVFVLAGLAFAIFIGNDLYGRAQTYAWQETSCVVTTSEVARERGDSIVNISYRYAYGGAEFTGDVYSRDKSRFDDHSDALRIARKFPAGRETVCYVNADDPSQAVLVQGGGIITHVFLLLIPALFVLIPGTGIWALWSKRFRPTAKPSPLSQKVSGRKFEGAFLYFFFSAFLLLGGALLVLMFLLPLFNVIRAQSWEETSCIILSSEVASHSNSDGTTYSIEILYRYEYDGESHESDRYSFMIGSTSGSSGKQRVVRQYPPGAERICYVNPNDPSSAVLNRGLSTAMWFGLIPLVFAAVGAGGLVYTVRKRRAVSITAPAAEGYAGLAPVRSMAIGPDGWLQPSSTPLKSLLIFLGIAIFWNGIVSVFVAEIIEGFQRERPQWFMTIFMIPFVGVGLVLIGAAGHQFLALFNPRPQVKLSAGRLTPGASITLEWRATGRVHKLRELAITLEGREEATYRRGTKTHTAKETFAVIPIARVDHPASYRWGQSTFTIPPKAIHSFEGANNKIVWAIHVRGEIPRWPDVDQEFAVTIHAADKR